MENIISIKQELFAEGNRNYTVKATINDSEVIEFNYTDTNSIFPLYNSLIQLVKKYKDAHIDLYTDERFATEISGTPNVNSRLLQILKNTREEYNVTINAIGNNNN